VNPLPRRYAQAASIVTRMPKLLGKNAYRTMTRRPAAGGIWLDASIQHVNRVKDMITRRAFGALAVGLPAVMATRFAAAEAPVKAEKNPPGDIPDDQVFIVYASPLGFALKVPEGWARTDRADGVVFADKYGKIEVAVTTGDLPTPKTAADAIKASIRAVDIKTAATADRSAGKAVYVAFDCNSEPNAVTNKQVRLENDRYVFAKRGKVASVTFSAPKGADNADQWLLMSESFQWR
jgi:hypothetical protein